MVNTMKKLLHFFEKNDDLRLFCMNGSRVNVRIPEDKFKDYDVVFFTDTIEKYSRDPRFLNYFGEILLMTEPDKDPLFSPSFPNKEGYIFLVQYKNGVRIDFQFRLLDQIETYLIEDSLTKVIKDKDQRRMPIRINPTDQDYWIDHPEVMLVESSVKEFWWQMLNVLKATIRGELLLAQFYITITRDELVRLMTWCVASTEGFERSYGKCHTQVLNYLPEKEREQLLTSYNTGSKEQIYQVLRTLGDLEQTYIEQTANFFHFEEERLKKYRFIPYEYLMSKGEDELAKFFIAQRN